MIKRLTVLVTFALTMTFLGLAAEPAPFTVMTQNMDAGTDLTYVVYGLYTNNLPGGVGLTYEEILSSAIALRADSVAAQVAARKPNLLALQEVTLWRTGDTTATATNVVADQLQLLLNSLAARKIPYDIVAINTVNDIALPMYLPPLTLPGAFRMTDRDVLLVRSDLRPPAFNISDVHANLFTSVYNIGPLQVPSGWISAMVHLGNRHFRLVTTHLQSSVPGDLSALGVQQDQARQLVYEVRNSTVPVVIAGDFNSDIVLGTGGPGPDNTGTASWIVSQGYADTWPIAGTGPGYTWPVYAEDQFSPLPFYGPASAFERIDLIFSQGLNVTAVERILSPSTDASVWPFYGSDHAAVMATFQF